MKSSNSDRSVYFLGTEAEQWDLFHHRRAIHRAAIIAALWEVNRYSVHPRNFNYAHFVHSERILVRWASFNGLLTASEYQEVITGID